MGSSTVAFFSVVCLIFLSCFSVLATDVSYDGRAIKINGERKVFLSGSIHYPRSTQEMWPDLIQKAKEGGLNAIETYVFWNIHEPSRRQYDFTGNRDIIRFLQTIQQAGLYAVLRIGPYVCAEWTYGGFPVWLHNMPGVELRTMNTVYLNEMKNFTTLIVDMVKQEKLFASQGGPVIIAQIENEYGNVDSPYGEPGKEYVHWCANFAESLDIGVPWIMCQQSDAPPPMINTCNGWYCDSFTPTNPNTPKMWTENWTGWFKNWGGKDPHRTAEDLSFSVARFFQAGGTFQNYYMYHGGTNFGRVAGGPYITTSYDYDAPLDEFGNLNQPKWGHLKELHLLLKSMEKVLTHGDVNTTDLGNFVTATVYNTSETSSCFLVNANETSDATITFQGTQYTVPAWSVSILPDCKNVVYNTAKINVQTSIMVKIPNAAEDEPSSLNWEWRPEDVRGTTLHGKGPFAVNQLLEQKNASNDLSDYLWYMTNVNLDTQDPIFGQNMSLRVNTTGHVLHAFVNGKHVGSQWDQTGGAYFVFEQKVNFKARGNLIVLLSGTVGLKNYGSFFDTTPTGILGPVQLVGTKNDEMVLKDLSSYKWTYKVGLHGEERHLFDDQPHKPWYTENLPINRMFTWYKASFKAPLGLEPVVVDLQGLGKGHAYVNGQSIGRYWPSFLADKDGCSINSTCDYRGPYNNNKCLTNCGQPSQRYYHVPRSFLNDKNNILVLFEEIGGNPSLVNFQTITIGSAWGNVVEGRTLELSCQGNRTISKIRFASFGDVQGTSGAFKKGTCEASNGWSVIEKACVGQERCAIDASEANLGSSNCGSDISKRLVVEAIC
ncbi:hypothetical protein NE237_012113 [Protea cynaroides]|uniref:Beta-galactosidase n=1 Tax=Protea cynaroides TaxID=273540 RepID=A0A9Q0GZJ1_9MAGN|nr:hypothetical protein NE237_012113 [Protea cynaroides]